MVLLLALVVLLTACGSEPQRLSSQGAPQAGDEAAGESVVDGVSADDLRELVQAAPTPSVRRRPGPTAEALTLPDGRPAWRVRIPGQFPLRSARAFVAVDDAEIGRGIAVPTLDALVVVVVGTDPPTPGGAVTVRWEGADPTGFGPLEVLR